MNALGFSSFFFFTTNNTLELGGYLETKGQTHLSPDLAEVKQCDHSITEFIGNFRL